MKWLLLLLGMLGFAAQASEHVFADPHSGLQVRKPQGWTFQATSQINPDRSAARTDEGIHALFAGRRLLPLVSLLQSADGPRVDIQLVDTRASISMSPCILMALTHIPWRAGLQEFEYRMPPSNQRFRSMEAAYSEMHYVAETASGQQHMRQARSWLIPRQGYAISIRFSAPDEQLARAQPAFQKIIASLKLI